MRRRLIVFVTLTALAAAATFAAVSGASFTTSSTTALRAATAPLSGDALRAYAGDGQKATAGTAVATAPSVKVTDAGGNPVSGVAVTFAVASGGGSASGGSAVTDSTGVAAAGGWTLGTTAGVNELTATASGLNGSVTFTATATAGAPTRILVTAGDTTPAAGGGVNLSAQLVDAYSNPVGAGGTAITWTRSPTSGTITGSGNTDANGVATATFAPVTTAGTTYTVTAASSGLISGTSSLTVVAGAPATITKIAGDGKSATVNTTLTTDPSVTVKDAYGNLISGATVTFTPASGSGSVTGGTQTTNSFGVATVTSWTLDEIAGTNTLTASCGAISADFTATGNAGAAARIVVTPSDTTPAAGTSVSMTAQIADTYGNAVATRKTVTWSKDAGTLSSSRTTTSSSTGATSVTFKPSGTAAGIRNTVTAASGTYTSGSATITVVAGPAGAMTITAGNSQSAVVGAALTVDPAVKVTDDFNNPVGGEPVTFAVASGGGSITEATQTTDSTGAATLGSWTLGTTAGANSVTATDGTLSKTFTATGTFGAASKLIVTAGPDTPAPGAAVTVSAQIADQYGNAVSSGSQTIGWSRSGGTLSATSSSTDSSGIATTTFTPGTTAGATYTITASRSGLTSGSDTVTVVAGSPASVTVNAGDGQSATVYTAVATDPSVVVKDSAGNVCPGVTVTFSGASGSGFVTGASATTDAAGVVTVGSWTLSKTAGSNTLTATAGSASETFTATGTPGALASITVNASDTSPKRNTTFTVSAQLLDAYGNKVTTSGTTVGFTTSNPTYYSFPNGSTDTSDVNGLATVSAEASSANKTSTITATAGSVSGSLSVTSTY